MRLEIKIYYMRKILHEYSNEKCRIILKNTGIVMSSELVTLIDDMILSDFCIHWQVAQLDMTLMTAVAPIKRIKEQ